MAGASDSVKNSPSAAVVFGGDAAAAPACAILFQSTALLAALRDGYSESSSELRSETSSRTCLVMLPRGQAREHPSERSPLRASAVLVEQARDERVLLHYVQYSLMGDEK